MTNALRHLTPPIVAAALVLVAHRAHAEEVAPALYRFGVAGRGYFERTASLAPWIGGSLGYVALTQSDGDPAIGDREDNTLHGFEATVEAGADTRFGFGPWASLGAGLFTSGSHTESDGFGTDQRSITVYSGAPHAVFQLGIRGAFDIAFDGGHPHVTFP